MKVKIHLFDYKGKEVLEIIEISTGNPWYCYNTYSEINDQEKTYEGIWNEENKTLTEIKEREKTFLTKEEVQEAIEEMNKYPDIFK